MINPRQGLDLNPGLWVPEFVHLGSEIRFHPLQMCGMELQEGLHFLIEQNAKDVFSDEFC